MILDSLQNLENYSEFTEIYRVLGWLAALPKSELPDARVELGNGSFAFPVSLTTKPEAECLYEAHKKYIDIHCVISGVETISVQNISEVVNSVPFDEAKDIGFYDGEEAARCYVSPGMFLVCFTEDAHRCAMMRDVREVVQKIMIKVKKR